jgi:hypothetical protein
VITDTQLKDQALGLTRRYADYTIAQQWLLGKLDSTPAHLLPPVESGEGENALRRLGQQVNSIGPRVLSTKRNGVIGDITWGGDNPRADELIRALNLEETANRLFERLFGYGIAAITAFDGEDGPRLSRLGGYLEPVLDPYDIDIVMGLFQVQAEKTERGVTKYRVRLWDWHDMPDELAIVREWDGVTDPSNLPGDGEPSEPIARPHWHIMQVGPDGKPLGEFQQALPIVFSEWASQIRGDRAEEATAFPLMKISGEVLGAEKRGPSHIVEVSADGDVSYLLPGDLRQMHEHHSRKLERLREDLSLPGGALGTQTPSGEALREANQKFIASCRAYANALTNLLSGGVNDYLALIGFPQRLNVNVDVNREFEKAERVQFILELYKENLVPLEAAVRSVSVYIPTWSDTEVEEFIARQTTRITPDSLRAALGVTDADTA